MAQKISMTIRVEAEDKESWEKQAEAAGVGLSRWIRAKLNGEASANQDVLRDGRIRVPGQRLGPSPGEQDSEGRDSLNRARQHPARGGR